MTFNTMSRFITHKPYTIEVLNLVINGWPSIPEWDNDAHERFKDVLNLVINGWPSIPAKKSTISTNNDRVLNLVINGWPSIPFEDISSYLFGPSGF